MNKEEIFQKIQDAYNFANTQKPGFPFLVQYSGLSKAYIAAIDVEEFSFDDTLWIPLRTYGYPDVLFTPDDLQYNHLTLDEICHYNFGSIPIKIRDRMHQN